ncbi:hypothetical protein C2G38_2166746 [Gigaspora rosea]|uniref:Uncharacterized protein n=1 Tax=Gigaspora rosea TaxID=44941 RepID=A0A397VTM5_9GLOM|nr:hypothetical protein C2G38_2166746 [Gigaspora rosea]
MFGCLSSQIRKSNGQEYKAPLLYTGFCALARGISEMFEETQVINLFDKHQFKSLHRILDGRMKSLVNDGDKNRKQSSLLEIAEIKFILNSSAMAVNNLKGLI